MLTLGERKTQKAVFLSLAFLLMLHFGFVGQIYMLHLLPLLLLQRFQGTDGLLPPSSGETIAAKRNPKHHGGCHKACVKVDTSDWYVCI